MRLEPVQLVASQSAPSQKASRRAFLIAGGTFFAGLGLGSALAPAALAAGAGSADAPLAEHDALLAELRDLATDRPLGELIASRRTLLHFVRADYRGDPVLLRGVERLARACLTMPDFPERFFSSRMIASAIDACPGAASSLRGAASQLKELR